MRRFERLFRELEESNKTSSKVGAMVRYFREVPPEDAVWALWFLTGHRFPALVRPKNLRLWTGDLAGYPDWLIEECYERVGDVAETAALLLPLEGRGTDQALGNFIRECVEPLAHWKRGDATARPPRQRGASSTASRLSFSTKCSRGAFAWGFQDARYPCARRGAGDRPRHHGTPP